MHALPGGGRDETRARSTAEPGEVVVPATAIARRIGELAGDIDAAFASADRPVVLLCVLKGSLFFTADLARALHVPVSIDTIAVRSYEGARSGGSVQLVKDVGMSLTGRDVLIVEDVVDTGLTIAFLLEHVAAHRPRSLRLVALLDKPSRRIRAVPVDFRGFEIGDSFVVGYGLDHEERWRELPDVRLLVGV